MATTITTADLAAELDTTPRELRKFLRAEGRGVGKGSRYALPGTKREVAALAKRFATWAQAQDEARQARQAALEAADEEIDEAPETETEPTDEEIEEIESEN